MALGSSNVVDLFKAGVETNIWIAPYGEAQPDETDVAIGGDWGGNWEKLGWTMEGVKVLYEFEMAKAKIQQALGAIDARKTSEEVRVECSLNLTRADRLATLTGGSDADVTETAAGASQVGFEELEIGNSTFIKKWAVGLESARFDADGVELPMRVFFTRAVFQMNGEFLVYDTQSDEYNKMPFIVEALADPSNSMKMLKWQRVTASATS